MKRGSRDEQKDIGTVFGTCNADRFCAAFSDAHSTPMYTEAMQKLMASGYNSVGSQISCGV